ncbi:MAG: hypothetical protein QM764_20825 [Chitinophagaceae bacterium]
MKFPAKTRLALGYSIIFFLTIIACRHVIPFPISDGISGGTGSTSDRCDSTKIYFQQQVLPILVSNCAQSGCHDNGSHREGIILVSYNSVTQTAGVQPGNAAGSKLYRVINGGSMPPRGYTALTAQQKDLIYQWIQQGAQNLVCESMCDSSVFTYSGAIQPLVANKCQGCHSTANPLGGVDLSNYASLKAEVDNGKLQGAVNWDAGFIAMPQNGSKLSDCELSQIQHWIAAGAPNN